MGLKQRKATRTDVDNVVKFPDRTTADYEGSSLCALLEIMPPGNELDGEDHGDLVRVVMVGQGDEFLSRARDYQERHAAALAEWEAWDDMDGHKDWSERHDVKFDEIKDKYDMACSALLDETLFKIVEVLE